MLSSNKAGPGRPDPGPAVDVTAMPPAHRPPNVLFIVADDLGKYHITSTCGDFRRYQRVREIRVTILIKV